jgi:hypothetical protein
VLGTSISSSRNNIVILTAEKSATARTKETELGIRTIASFFDWPDNSDLSKFIFPGFGASAIAAERLVEKSITQASARAFAYRYFG